MTPKLFERSNFFCVVNFFQNLCLQGTWGEACGRPAFIEGSNFAQLGQAGHQPSLLQHVWSCNLLQQEVERAREKARGRNQNADQRCLWQVLKDSIAGVRLRALSSDVSRRKCFLSDVSILHLQLRQSGWADWTSSPGAWHWFKVSLRHLDIQS